MLGANCYSRLVGLVTEVDILEVIIILNQVTGRQRG